MLHVLTNPNSIEKNRYIHDVELAFNSEIEEEAVIDDTLIRSIMQEIDGASVLENKKIVTKIGKAHIKDLSSGCKALILAIKFPNKIVNFTEAGNNVVRLAVELSQQLDISIYTQNFIMFSGLDDIKVDIDGDIMTVDEWMIMNFNRGVK